MTDSMSDYDLVLAADKVKRGEVIRFDTEDNARRALCLFDNLALKFLMVSPSPDGPVFMKLPPEYFKIRPPYERPIWNTAGKKDFLIEITQDKKFAFLREAGKITFRELNKNWGVIDPSHLSTPPTGHQ